MIYRHKKYKDIEAFILGNPVNNNDIEYSLVFGNCEGISENKNREISFNNKCFGCLFCAFGNMKESFIDLFGHNQLLEIANKGFNGEIVDPVNARLILGNPYRNLECFTKTAETKNIQPWAAGILQSICKKPCRVGMEIQAPNDIFDRDGRLDVCAMTNDFLMVFETKTSLDDALNDERFVEQHAKYSPVISKHLNNNEYFLSIMIGGKETDLLPESHELCSSRVGEKSERFYKLISEYSIPFISANALWLLALSNLLGVEKRSADDFFRSIAEDSRVVGIVTAGKIVFNGEKFIIEAI